MRMKGRIIDIGEYEDEIKNTFYKVTIMFEKTPKLMLGDAEVIQ